MSIDRDKLKRLFSNKRSQGKLYSLAEKLESDLPFDAFHVHNVGDVTLPLSADVSISLVISISFLFILVTLFS